MLSRPMFAWLTARVGVENACLLDITRGEISGAGGRIIIDENLLKKISFIKEGEFVEKSGAPTLRLVGDVQTIETGKMVVAGTKHVIKAIEQTDIIESFLRNENVENPIDYIKRICSSTSGNLPVYHYLKMCDRSKDAVIEEIEAITIRGTAKKTLIARIKGEKGLKMRLFPAKETPASKRRKTYVDLWLAENIPESYDEKSIKNCLEALQFLDADQIREHEHYIKERLLALYKQFYESSDSLLAQIFRTAICYLDEVLNCS